MPKNTDLEEIEITLPDGSKKKATLKPVIDNHIMFHMPYDHFVLPFEEGVKLIGCLKNAEQVKNVYSDKRIVPIECKFDTTILSHQEYAEAKLKFLIEGDENNE